MSEENNKKSALVPRLRFPEFQDAGEWEAAKLGFLGTFTGGGTPTKDNASYWSGSNPWVSSSDISEDNIHEIKISRFISDEAIQETATKVVPANSILLVSRVGVGKLAITREKICTSQDFTSFTPAKDNLVFLAYSLKAMKETFLSFNQGMAIKGFTKDDASNVKIPLPTKVREQQKIADCLSSLDELITAETQVLNALKTHKKGLMQQLFPREGETVPRLRFPEFRDAGEWEVRELGCLCKIRTGKKDVNEGSENGLYPFFTCAERHIYCNTYSFDAEAILISGNANVGQTKYYKGKFEAYQRTYVLTNFAQVSVPYLYLYLSAKLSDSLAKQVQTSAMSYIKLPMLESYKVPSPKESREQQKIADCLSSLDELITAQSQKIEALKKHKKGLMQQLFPVLDEVPA